MASNVRVLKDRKSYIDYLEGEVILKDKEQK